MEKNIMMALSMIVPIGFIIASKWLVPLLEKRFKEKAKTVYFVVVFVIIIVFWYLVDTHYGIHMGLW
jgi:Kef-type K+ transport system membrane component KefB